MQSKCKISGKTACLAHGFYCQTALSLATVAAKNATHEEIRETMQTLQQTGSQRPLALKTAKSKSP